jgi:hypothetical protein
MNGCGGTCPACASGDECKASTDTCCVPNCANAVCGADDGCGFACQTGTCSLGSSCVSGVCEANVCSPACSYGYYCTDGNCEPYCNPASAYCGNAGCCVTGESCNHTTGMCVEGG